MSKLRKFNRINKKHGIWQALKEGLRYILDGSPAAPYIRSLLGEQFHEKLYMRFRLGYWPRIRNPRTFNEKVIYRKVNTNNDLFSTIEDKWKVREYVANRVSRDVLPDIYYVTDNPGTIPFDELPEKYVIKPTHMSGPLIFVEENQEPDRRSIQELCREWLDAAHGTAIGEYWYSSITPRIIVEEYLQDADYEVPPDFKFFVFHGEVEYIQVDIDRHNNHMRRFYDSDWNPKEFKLKGYPLAPKIPKPEKFNKMVEIAERLGEDFSFIRVDLYQINEERVVFGEMTPAPGSGGSPFQPRKYDFEFGSLWDLSKE